MKCSQVSEGSDTRTAKSSIEMRALFEAPLHQLALSEMPASSIDCFIAASIFCINGPMRCCTTTID